MANKTPSMPDEEYTKAQLDQAAAELKRQTPADWLHLREYISNLEKNWPEAPASVNLRCVYPNGHAVQWTLRDFEDIMLHDRLELLFERLIDAGAVPERIPAIRQAPSEPLIPVTEEVETVSETSPFGAEEKKAEPDVYEFHCVQMGIAPREDGKVTLRFFGNDRKQPVNEFATVQFVGTPVQAANLLKEAFPSVLPAHLEKAKRSDVSLTVFWKNSTRKTSSGSFYKDVVRVESAE